MRGLVIFSLLSIATMSSACGGAAGPDQGFGISTAQRELRPLWSADTSDEDWLWGSRNLHMAAPVLTEGGMIYVATNQGELVSLSAVDGRENWRVDVGELITATPLLVDGVVYVGTADGILSALDGHSGSKLWSFDAAGPIESSPAVAGEQVFVANALNRLFALDRSSGELQWRAERSKVNDFTMFGHATPLVFDDKVAYGYSDGQLMVYERETGATVWGRDLSLGNERYRDVDEIAAFTDGQFFAASFSGGLSLLQLEENEVKWHREIEGATGIRVQDKVIYFSSVLGVHAARTSDGADIWHYPLGSEVLVGAPTVGVDKVYVPLQREGLLVLDRRTGQRLALADLGSGFSASPALSAGLLVALSNRGAVYGFKVADSPL